MAIEFEFVTWDTSTNVVNAKIRIELQEDGDRRTWKRIAISDGTAYSIPFPQSGTWNRMHTLAGPATGLNDTLLLHSQGNNGPIASFGAFFPPQISKQGKLRIGSSTAKIPVALGQFTIRNCPQPILKSFPEKFVIVVGYAMAESPGLVPGEVWKMLTEPTFIGMLALNFIKSPWAWFNVLKSVFLKVAGTIMAVWMIMNLAYRMNGIIDAIDCAYLDSQLKTAGHLLAQWLAEIVAIVGVEGVSSLIKGVIKSKKEQKGKSESEDKPPETAIPVVPIKVDNWRTGYKRLLAEADRVEGTAESAKGLAEFVRRKERAAGLRIQAAFLKQFVVETIQHMEWVKKVTGDVNSNIAALIGMSNKTGSNKTAIAKLIADTTKAGAPLSQEEAAGIFQTLTQAGPHQKWNFHDVETELTSKLNDMISSGMKHPINLRDLPWSAEQLDKAARGINPQTNRKFTMQDLEKIFGYCHANTLVDAYGEMINIMKTSVESKASIEKHNEVDHHQFKKPTEWTNARWLNSRIEKGIDTAHAMLQDRMYRLKRLSVPEAVATVKGDPMVKFGMAIFSKYDRDSFSDASKVTQAQLDAYNCGDLADFAKNITPSGWIPKALRQRK